MNHLGFSYLETFDNIESIRDELDKLPENIDKYTMSNDIVIKKNEENKNELSSIKNMKMDNDYVSRNDTPDKKIKQQKNDYYSIVLQEKFILALGGLTLFTLMILNNRI